jgi:transposase
VGSAGGEPQRLGEEIGERLEYLPTSWHVIEEACEKHACAQGCVALTAPRASRFEEKPMRSATLLRPTHLGRLGLQDPRLSPPDPV